MALCLSGCHDGGPRPDAVYQSVYADYLHGNLAQAQTRAHEAQKSLQDVPEWSWKFRLLEAEVLLRQNQPADAIALLATGSATGGDGEIKYNTLRAISHSRLGQTEPAAQELQRAHQLAQETHSPLLADVLRAEGLVARDAKQPEDALEKFRSSLAAAGNGNELVKAADLVDIGFYYLHSERYGEAVTWSQRAAQFARSLQAGRQLELALGNAGWALQNVGDFDNALSHFQEAEQQARAIGLAAHRAVWLQNAGLAQYRLGNLAEARHYDEQALEVTRTLPPEKTADQIANIQANLALLLYEQGQLDAARQYSAAAVQIAANSTDDTVFAYCQYVHGLLADENAEAILMSGLQRASDSDVRAEIESALAKLHADRHETDQARSWYRRSIRTFEDKRSTVQEEALRLSAFAYGEPIYRDYAQFLIETNQPLEALQLLDRSRSRTLEDGLGLQKAALLEEPATDPRKVARDLKATILFYSLSAEQSHLWAVTGNEIRLCALPGRKAIQSLVKQHQTDIQQAADPATPALYDALVKPAAALIPAGTRVFVIADDVLHSLNFETLLTNNEAGPHYWIEDVAITTASSIRMLARAKQEPRQLATTKELLLIGDPTPPRGDFAPLPDAAREIQQVRRHFQPGNQLVLAQAQAVPTAYAANNPKDFRYIHFAAHGTASRSSPLDSAVVLSPPAQEPDDFKLYARDIVQQPLNATLVTISACYGSGVRAYAGEGLVGLAWVFLRAGAHNVIAALWQVADAASPLLMDQLYSELEAGKSPDEALRAAKLAMIHSSRIYRKPLFWGAFQLYAGS